MATKVNVGLRIPAVEPADPKALRAWVTHAEELGYHSIWAGDHVFYHMDVPQPLHLLTWVAAMTERVRLGTAVMLTAYQNPVLLAKAAATLDRLSGGRLTLGVSLGGTEAEYNSLGVPLNQRVGRLLENVSIMRRLWQAEGDVSFEGRYNKLESANIRPKPVQQPGVPIYFGAASEAMRRRAARLADGWCGSGAGDAAAFMAQASEMRGWVAAAGRDAASFGYAKLHNVSVHPDAAAARELARAHWQGYYGPRFNVDNTTHGTAADCAEKLAVFRSGDIGELTLALEPAGLGLDHLDRLWQATEGLRKG